MPLAGIAQGVMIHADAAIRQLSFDEQRELVEELSRRVDRRAHQTKRERVLDARACAGKRRHETFGEAEGRRRRKPNAARLNSYECQNCQGWHLGHPNPRFR